MEKNTACERGLALIEGVSLSEGKHKRPRGPINSQCEMCVMELRNAVGMLCEWEGYTRWTDTPKGESWVITRLLQCLNDRIEHKRQDLKQFVLCDLSNRGRKVEQRRLFAIVNFMCCEIFPRLLDAAGMKDEAKEAGALGVIDGAGEAHRALLWMYRFEANPRRQDVHLVAWHCNKILQAVYGRDRRICYSVASAIADYYCCACFTTSEAADKFDKAIWKLTLEFVHELIAMGAQ
jgi:hypothetical protein